MIIYSVKNKDAVRELELADLPSKVKQGRLEESLGKQSFHFHDEQLFKPVTNAVADKSKI